MAGTTDELWAGDILKNTPMHNWLLFLLLLWPLLWALRITLVTRALMGLEFRKTKMRVLALADIPPHLKEATKPWVAQLEGLDFVCLGGWRVNGTSDPAFDSEALVLQKTTYPIVAVIQSYVESSRSGECWLSLRTTRSDGTEMITSSYAPEQLVPMPPGIETEVMAAASPDELVQRHLVRIRSAGNDFWHCDGLSDAAIREQHVRDAILGFAYEKNLLKESGDGDYRYFPGAAVKRSIQIIRLASKKKKEGRKNQRSVVTHLSAESQTEFDLQHYRQQGALMRGRFSLKAKTVVSVLSFLVFAAVLAFQYSVAVATALIVALVIHECGHLSAMRWFGFRDLQLLFVPFFGGAAVGHDDRVLAPWKHIVIILCGPIPGIFIAFVLLVYAAGGGAPEWITGVATTFLILNAFNLLPILPLDGGQIVDYAVATRFPRVRVLFVALSAIGLMVVGLGFGGVKILVGLGLITLLRLPVEWRLATLRRATREEFPDGGDEEPIVRRLIGEMREPEWKKSTMSQRLQFARGLQRVLRMPRPGVGTMCFALAGFMSPLWLGAPLAVWSVGRQGNTRVEQAQARAKAAGLLADIPEPKAGEVQAEENAAIPYEEAVALTGNENGGGFARVSPEEARIVALLHAAAQKRFFVPTHTADKSGPRRIAGMWNRDNIVIHLTMAATERLRYHEATKAAALSIDALKLLRLMESAPAFLGWTEYQFTAGAAWRTIEEALAMGAKISPDQVNEIRELCDESTDVKFAVTAIPRGMLSQVRALTESELTLQGGATVGLLRLIARSNPTWAVWQVTAIDQAVVAQKLMQAVGRGEWPRTVGDKGNSKLAISAVAEFGDFIARLRLAKAALLLLDQRTQGAKSVSLEKLAIAPAELAHPYTHEPMRLTRLGAMEVLSFKSVPAPEMNDDENDAENPALVWRIPVAVD